MDNQFGSVWHKWDFHIHTPYSILNNNYGFSPLDNEESGVDDEKEFDVYVKTLFTKAIENDVSAIGITDYFMIDGYKRIREKYLSNPGKMKELFPDDELRRKVEEIYVFPNIELRLDSFIGEKANSVNYHVIFSDQVPVEEIEEDFLMQLSLMPSPGAKQRLTRGTIKRFGRKIKEDNQTPGSDFLVGLKHIAVNYRDILDVLATTPAFADKYLVTIPVDEDLSDVQWAGRDYPTRKILYSQCHCYLTSNAKTAKWALAEGEEEERKREFGSIKPCIWGSDAHEYERMFKPANDKSCWVKSELSFDGLLQILYEPKDRVAVQKKCPDEKDAHQIIQSIQFDDEKFQSTPIVFNDSLTCIIGGKSTGKSLLLRQLAVTIDPEHTAVQESTVNLRRKPFPVNKPKVTWKDGTSDNKKIIYIPQTFLNRTIDNPEEATAINNIVADVLKQEPEISEAYSKLDAKRKEIKKKTRANIAKYCDKRVELNNIKESIKQEGTSASFRGVLAQLEEKRAELASKTDISQEQIERYAELENVIRELEERLGKIALEVVNFSRVSSPAVVIPGFFDSNDGISITHDFNTAFPDVAAELYGAVKHLTQVVQNDWNSTCEAIDEKLEANFAEVSSKLSELKEEYRSLKVKVEQNEQLQQLSQQIASEREKLNAAVKREMNRSKVDAEIETLAKDIVNSQQEYQKAYDEYCSIVIETGTKKNTSLIFDAKPIWKKKDFQLAVESIFDNRYFTSFGSYHRYNLASVEEEDYGSDFLSEVWDAMTSVPRLGSLFIKTAYTTETAMQQLFGDWYNIHYIVTSGKDTIEDMSPGKKALVLLELLISLEDSKCPILIDQPEDDLDNRSIYDDLVQYIKNKKRERQIIVVTHNANVVLGADAEEVIIANQDGKGTENANRRFEYRSGAIENDRPAIDEQGEILPGILNQHGIQTQICDILEGGPLAFELRKNKYKTLTV